MALLTTHCADGISSSVKLLALPQPWAGCVALPSTSVLGSRQLSPALSHHTLPFTPTKCRASRHWLESSCSMSRITACARHVKPLSSACSVPVFPASFLFQLQHVYLCDVIGRDKMGEMYCAASHTTKTFVNGSSSPGLQVLLLPLSSLFCTATLSLLISFYFEGK